MSRKKVEFRVPGTTKNEIWNNLCSIVSEGCSIRQEQGEFPEMLSLGDGASIHIVDEEKEVKTRIQRYEELLKEARFYLQSSETQRAKDLSYMIGGAMSL